MLRVVCATEGHSLTSLPFKACLPHHTASYAVSWVHLGSRKWDWEGEWEWGGGGGEAGGRVSDLWAGSSGPGCTYFACWEPIKRWRWAHALHCGKACDTLVFFLQLVVCFCFIRGSCGQLQNFSWCSMIWSESSFRAWCVKVTEVMTDLWETSPCVINEIKSFLRINDIR